MKVLLAKLRNRLALVFIGLIFVSCGNQLIKQGPSRSKFESFYKLDEVKPFIYKKTCKDIKKDPRDCVIVRYDIVKEWDLFRGGFVLVPFKYVFP